MILRLEQTPISSSVFSFKSQSHSKTKPLVKKESTFTTTGLLPPSHPLPAPKEPRKIFRADIIRQSALAQAPAPPTSLTAAQATLGVKGPGRVEANPPAPRNTDDINTRQSQTLSPISSSSMPSQVPRPYALFFKTLDPIIAIWGFTLFLFSPETVTSSYLPPSYTPQTIDPSMVHPASLVSASSIANSLREYSLPLNNQIAGHLLSNALFSIFLLRATDSVAVWRIYQLGLLIVDVLLLYGTFASYALQGRLNPLTTWRAEDWGAVAITTLATLIRTAFLFGVGFPKAPGVKRA
ncbi:hypothetical protein C8034_v008166 [Colletotrichum sidae]|uniref:DUF7704 domain-containing protein n=1 Tax=Colletotrichum sidae TaxID=1347389 RepID=A0A4R8TQ90_9PEZI|nr:hypothetical protein C8034_v008166 [Colletotrichum sidae]